MPTCLAYGCSNTTGRVKNKRFYKIPDPKKERQHAVRSLHNMGNSKFSVSNFISSRNKVLCEDHFHINCIKRDLEFEMMGSSSGFPKRELVEGSIPTIFSHKVYDQINMDGTVVLNRPEPRKRTMAMEQTQVRSCYMLYIIKFNLIKM